MKRKLQSPISKFPYLGLSIVFFLPLLIIFCYHLAYWQKIYPGITILGQSLGNQSFHSANQNIENLINKFHFNSLILRAGEQILTLELSNFQYLPEQTARKAWKIGRDSNFKENLKQKFLAWTKGIDLTLEYTLDEEILNQKIEEIASLIFIPSIEPEIKINNQKEIEISLGKEGMELDKEKLIETIKSHLSHLDFSPIDLPIIRTSPSPTEEQINQTKTRAEKFLNKKIILIADEMKWELKDSELVQLLSFTNGYNQEKIVGWTTTLASAINRPPVNAAFEFHDGKVTQFRAAKNGLKLELDKTIDLIVHSLTELENGKKEIIAQLPVVIIPPQVLTDNVNQLGIQQLIGRGISFFRGSISSRIHNIELASSKINGLLISPGEIFSFNQAVGEISPTTGFKQAYIIKNGRTILGDGGGICQVSTTLFRAALNAGLPIIERHPHTYRVSYYEQDSFPGLDATVFNPSVDLKIQNDTPSYLLIQTYIDTKNYKLTIEFYGTDDGRKVIISKPRIWDQIPPPPDIYQDDPTLPAGQIKQIEWKAWGAKVAFDYRVERENKILQNRTFYSIYHPWQAIFLKGTGQ